MGFMKYASFLDSSKYVMANARQFGSIMRRHGNFVVTRQRSAE
jgi:hypothetical protein